MVASSPRTDTRTWAFNRSELMAGLRQFTDDQTLNIVDISALNIPYQRAGERSYSWLRADCESAKVQVTFDGGEGSQG
jgi:hypothetical protein